MCIGTDERKSAKPAQFQEDTPMLQGLTLVEMATELARQQDSKRDYIADSRRIELNPLDGKLHMEGHEPMGLQRNAERQLATFTGIPQKYYDRMPETLRAWNVNHWLKSEHSKRMVRTIDGNCRALLSDRYRVIDNAPVVESVLPVLAERQDMQIVSSHIGEDRFYLKALFPRTQLDVGVGDPVQAGLVISNSETGNGSFRIELLIFRLVCLNGMVTNSSLKKYHVGRAAAMDAEVSELFADETIKADEAAFMLKVRDLVKSSMDMAQFEMAVGSMAAAKEWAIEAPVPEVIERVTRQFSMTQDESGSVLNSLITNAGRDGGLNQFALANAVTETAHALPGIGFERSIDLERMGGLIIDLDRSQWERIAA